MLLRQAIVDLAQQQPTFRLYNQSMSSSAAGGAG